MICPQCKKQIPDKSNECGFCGAEINHQEQVGKEISYRRYQRWFFYALILFIFLGMILVIVQIYNANSENLARLATMEERVAEAEEELGQQEQELQETEAELSQKEQELQNLTQELQEEVAAKAEIREEYDDCYLNINQLDPTDAYVYNLLVQIGTGVPTEKLDQIPLADVQYPGKDSDGDGLPDVMEYALPTDPYEADTDDDGFDDREEYVAGYNPVGEGKLEPDQDFIDEHKGRILLQVEDDNQAWYLDHEGKRYFLGNPGDAYETLRSLEHCWDYESGGEEEPEEFDAFEDL